MLGDLQFRDGDYVDGDTGGGFDLYGLGRWNAAMQWHEHLYRDHDPGAERYCNIQYKRPGHHRGLGPHVWNRWG